MSTLSDIVSVDLSTVNIDYASQKERYELEGETPDLYRGFEIYYNAPNGGVTHIDLLSSDQGCYSITNKYGTPDFWDRDENELEATAKAFIDEVFVCP